MKGTEFTVYVAEDGSSTFTVIEGQVDVEENITKNTVTLGPGQSVTIYPYTTGTTLEATTHTVDLSQLDRWWDEPFEQPSAFPLLIVVSVAGVVVIVIGLTVIVIIRRKKSQAQNYLPPPPPPISYFKE